MIKLEDLKKNDILYIVSEDEWRAGLYTPSKVRTELDIINIPEPIEGVWCIDGGVEIVNRSMEKYLFRTEEEAIKERERLVLKKAKELLNSEYFLDRLLECSISSKRLRKYGELEVFQKAIELYKNKLIKGGLI